MDGSENESVRVQYVDAGALLVRLVGTRNLPIYLLSGPLGDFPGAPWVPIVFLALIRLIVLQLHVSTQEPPSSQIQYGCFIGAWPLIHNVFIHLLESFLSGRIACCQRVALSLSLSLSYSHTHTLTPVSQR